MAPVREAMTGADWDAARAVLLEYPDRVLFIADLDGMAAGTVALWCDGHGGAELKRMYVRPVARGRGIADALIGAALAAASEYGCRTVWLESVRGAMDPAIAVYRRNGFRIAGHRRRTLAVDGVVVMERPLEEASRCA